MVNLVGLYQNCVDVLKKMKPKFFVAENVGGLVSRDAEWDIIQEAFSKVGYNISFNLYKFEEYGVPQYRKRIVIVGFQKKLKINFTHPRPPQNAKIITAKKALSKIDQNAKNQELTNHSKAVVERLKYIKPGENVFTANLPSNLKIDMKSGATISQIYKRLSPDRPSYTVTGSGGGGTHIYHWEENRALTNRERARLQTFPDKFEFVGGKEAVRRQIGMAVPPKAAEVIFNSVLETLVKERVSCDDE